MKELERNRLNVGNYKSALKNYKPKESFWDKVKDIIHSIFPF